MRNPRVIQVGVRTPGDGRLRSSVRQRHRGCRVKIETALSLARLGIFVRLRLADAASAKQEMSRSYFHRKAALFISEASSSLRSPNKALEPTSGSVTSCADRFSESKIERKAQL